MIQTFEKETILQFKVIPPLFLPFYNRWNENAYYKYEAFELDPFTLNASSTSGSPIVIAAGSFFGFLNETGGIFAYDGIGILTITCSAGQSLYYNENCNPYAEWEQYNSVVLERYPQQTKEKFWGDIEYCTWVEQKKEAVLRGKKEMQACLNEQFVYDYMKRVNKLGLPKGKLTIDDGWYVGKAADGKKLYGNWEIDRTKFPNMEKLVKDMKEDGFEPGLWFSPFTFTTNCELAMRFPDLVGEVYAGNSEAGHAWVYIRPDEVLKEYYTKVFTYYAEIGFRKFKLDIAYGNKAQMKQLLSMIYKIIKLLDSSIEVECHVPDIFVSRFCDTVRMNDVNFDEKGLWRGATLEHYKVCRYSSPDKILNLDHLGTNTPVPKLEEYLEHTRMLLALKDGYPCVSLLPDFFGMTAAETFAGSVREWQEQTKNQ